MTDASQRYLKYFRADGPFGKPGFQIGQQGFSLFWEDDPSLTRDEEIERRAWMGQQIATAFKTLVDIESADLLAAVYRQGVEDAAKVAEGIGSRNPVGAGDGDTWVLVEVYGPDIAEAIRALEYKPEGTG